MNGEIRNILFITTDQQRRDSLPCYGLPFMRTPAIDRLAAGGVVFDNAIAAAPICQPCRAAFITGQYPHVNGVANNFRWIRPGTPTLAHAFHNAGWQTAAIGKMHFHPWDNPEGFQHRVSAEDKRHFFRPDDHAQFLRRHGYERRHPAYENGYEENLGAIVSPLPKELHIDSFIGMEAVSYLERVGEEPFFCWVSFNSPHDPYDPPAEMADMYRDAPVPEPIGGLDELQQKPAYQRRILDFFRDNSLYFTDYRRATAGVLRRMREYYLASVSLVDEQIGRILAILDRRGLTQNTLIVFSSDHGDHLGDHGLPYKGTFYESSLGVPLIVSGPGVSSGARCRSMVDWVDLHRTFLCFAGIEPPAHVQGCDVGELFSDPHAPGREVGFSELPGKVMACDGNHKLVLCDDEHGELYDLHEHPLEVHNRFHDPAYAEPKQRLTRMIIGHVLGHSKVTRFGGGAHDPDAERDNAVAEARRLAAAGAFPGLSGTQR